MAAVMTALWYELVFFAHKPTPEILAMYALLGALACIGCRHSQTIRFLRECSPRSLLRCVFNTFPALAVAGFFALKKLDARSIGYALGGFGAVVLLAGALDWLTWGHWFVSFYNYYLFNQTYNISSSFGVRPVWYYAASLAITSGGLMWLAPLGARRGFEGFLAAGVRSFPSCSFILRLRTRSTAFVIASHSAFTDLARVAGPIGCCATFRASAATGLRTRRCPLLYGR